MDTWDSFIQVLRRSKGASMLLSALDFTRGMDISRTMELCPLQDPFRFRAKFFALEVANLLIDDAGQLNLTLAKEVHDSLAATPFFIGPRLENDVFIFRHIQSALQALLHTDAIQKLLQKFSLPLCHEGAARLVQSTLWPKTAKPLTVADIQRAVLATWFTFLRQTTGSCFATAPAILIQKKEPLQFLKDLFDLLTFGELSRVISGTIYSVPLCPTLEQFDLTRPLKGFSPQLLSLAPGLRAALGAAGFSLSQLELQELIAQEQEAKTPKELIERILLRLLELPKEDVVEEETLKTLNLHPLLARDSAIFFQKPSARASKVAQWKQAFEKATTAYQSLGDCALLRAWESTVASFSDVKLDVAKWNLYLSLGLHPDYPGGVGAFLYTAINTKLASYNEQIGRLQEEYEHLAQIADSAEKRGIQGEYSHAIYRVNAIRVQIDEYVREGEALSKLFPILIERYDKLIPESFQEIFDPSLALDVAEMIDDSPAGFRLAYKHGRSSSAQWTYIHTEAAFISALREFFEAAERELTLEMSSQKAGIQELTTQLIQYIQTPEFLEQAINRTKKNPTVQDPRAKPWQYISGGTMPALLMAYYNRQNPFSCLKKKIQNVQELLSFIIECNTHAKEASLINSHTHAFIFVPEPLLADSLKPHFWQQMVIKDPDWLIEKLSLRFPEKEAALFLHRWRQSHRGSDLPSIRRTLIEILGEPQLPLIDSFFWESLPLIDDARANEVAHQLGLHHTFEQPLITPTELREHLKLAFIKKNGLPLSSVDLDTEIAEILRQKGLAAPKPHLFADTNWSTWFFGIAFSPSGHLELWRFHRTGMSGIPMNSWFQLQCGEEWVLFNRPQEYKLISLIN